MWERKTARRVDFEKGDLERKLSRCQRAGGGSEVDMNKGVCVCMCVRVCVWRVMRPDQRDGKPSRLLT